MTGTVSRADSGQRRSEEQARGPQDTRIEAPPVDIDPSDPLLVYVRSNPSPVDLTQLKLDSPAADELRAAGVQMVVPLVAQGELIGMLNLGPRLSEQDYSSDDRELLERLAGQAAPALRVSQLAREQEAEARLRERYEQEMRIARLIQQNFLPEEAPQPQGWDLHALYRPAREVGGDFYDFIDLEDGRLGIVVGDVTDKGVPAALVMASTRSVLRAAAHRLVDPGPVLERVNGQLQPDIPENMFVTCLYGVLEPDSGRFRFANAGHNLPCIQTEDGAVEVEATGMPLGLMPGMNYEESEVVVGAGRSVLFYSDALPEAHSPDGEMFGFPRLVATVGDAPGGSELIDAVLEAVDGFTAEDWEEEDDITIVVLARSGTADPAFATEARGPRELVSFSLPSEPGREREAMDRVSSAIAELPLAEGQLEQVETAVSEATMNAIEHGNETRSELLVDVRVAVDGDRLLIGVTDQRVGGDAPTTEIRPDLEAKLRGDQSPRGWGLFLIENMVDEVHVDETDDRRTVELVVRMDGDPDE